MPCRQALLVHIGVGNMPGTPVHAPNAAQVKGVQPHAVGRAARIGGGGHIFVVALVVLNKKVRVQAGKQQAFGQPLFNRFYAMPKLVPYIDAKYATQNTHADGAARYLGGGKIRLADGTQKQQQAAVLQYHYGIQQRIKNRVFFRHFVFGGAQVGGVGAQQQFQQGDDAKGQHRRGPHGKAGMGKTPNGNTVHGERQAILYGFPMHVSKVNVF